MREVIIEKMEHTLEAITAAVRHVVLIVENLILRSTLIQKAMDAHIHAENNFSRYKMKIIQIIALLLLSKHCFSWEGQNTNTGTQIEIESGNLVRDGEEVEVYDYDLGSYHTVEINNISQYGSIIELEVTDLDTGDQHILEMED